MSISTATQKQQYQLLYLSGKHRSAVLEEILFSESIVSTCNIVSARNIGEAIAARREKQFDACILNAAGDADVVRAFLAALKKSCLSGPPDPVIVISTRKKAPHLKQMRHAAPMLVYEIDEVTAGLLEQAVRLMTDTRQLYNSIKDREVRYEAVLDAIAEGVVICDTDGTIQSINYKAEQIFQIESNEIGSVSLDTFVARPFKKEVRKYFRDSSAGLSPYSPVFSPELKGRRSTGERFPMELIINSTQVSNTKFHTCIVRDISLAKIREEELQLTATAFETHTAILITDAKGTILRVNPAFTSITGYGAHEVVGKNPKMLQSGHHNRDFYQALWKALADTGKWEGEIWNKRKNGEIYPEYQTITAVKNNAGEISHYVGTFQDITERKQTQALIEHQAYYDALTNLPNRRMVLDRLNQELAAARRHKVYGALLFLDLDHFKHLNDSMGHMVGDQLLQQLARRLSGHVRAEDTVARLGGDEFVVLLTDLGQSKKHATSMVSAVAKKIHQAIARPYSLEGHFYNFTPSIGVTLFPVADDSADDVLKHADTAMYRAKSKGRNTICFYQPSMQAEADRRLRVEKELRTAIDNREFLLYYQPQFNNKGVFVGAEALLRWEHPRNGIVDPAHFISFAEESNLIQPIGGWALETAVRQYTIWRDNSLFRDDAYIAVNVSPKQLEQDDFVGQVGVLLSEYCIAPRSLKLELTENILLYDLYDVIDKMNQLKSLGVSFAMDDFGTGFSSLSYLKRLPFDQIKIDKTFIRDVSVDMNDAVIVETIIAMAEHLRLDVIAEGVETEEEFEFLQSKGCNNYQGYFFGRPLATLEFEKNLRRYAHTKSVRLN